MKPHRPVTRGDRPANAEAPPLILGPLVPPRDLERRLHNGRRDLGCPDGGLDLKGQVGIRLGLGCLHWDEKVVDERMSYMEIKGPTTD